MTERIDALKALLEETMPLNREERYWSATVLPMLACGSDLERLPSFLGLMHSAAGVPRDFETDRLERSRTLFFTEYDLRKSNQAWRLGKAISARSEWSSTPDLVVVDATSRRRLYAVEAKMFGYAEWLGEQMKEQRNGVLQDIAATLEILPDDVIHAALLPCWLMPIAERRKLPAVDWQSVLDLEEEPSYFRNTLELALMNSDRLVSKKVRYLQARRVGSEIVSANPEEAPAWIGVGGGTSGKRFQLLLKTGTWRNKRFEVTWKAERPNSNWMSWKDFCTAAGVKMDSTEPQDP